MAKETLKEVNTVSNTNTFNWKIKDIYPVEAQKAGEELERIYAKYGHISPENVVNESRESSATLHSCFEWDDGIAAEKYRAKQAQGLIKMITITETKTEKAPAYRAFVCATNNYEPLRVVLSDEDKTKSLLKSAIRELNCFKAKYRVLSELSSVFAEIERLEV